MKTIVALYDDFAVAQHATQELIANGFDRSNISLIAGDATGEYGQYVNDPSTTSTTPTATETTAVSAGAGALVGSIGGLLVGIGALAIPGIGPIIAAGPLVSTLIGAGVGAMAGGLVGALTSLGVPETEAGYYAEGIRQGGALVTVQTPDDKVEQAKNILDQHHPVDIEERVGQWQEKGWTSFDPNAQPYQASSLNQASSTYYSDMTDDDDSNIDDNYAAYETGYRQHYTANYASSGYTYEQYAPAYRYGYDLAVHPSYNTYSWVEVEPAARQSWEETNPGTWDQFKDAVRHGWEELKDVVGIDDDDYLDSEENLHRHQVSNRQF